VCVCVYNLYVYISSPEFYLGERMHALEFVTTRRMHAAQDLPLIPN
jgi:hypothetical protein